MAFAPQKGDGQVSISVFAGLVTEMAAVDLPEGVSPDCQDVVFVPGSVATRPGVQKVFAVQLPPGGPNNLIPTVTYGKTFVTPTGDIENLYLDSNGTLWWEDVTNTPGTYTQLAITTPGSYAKSITANGREYIAISDGLHGTECPLQWDGVNLDRVTQDAPGTPPNVASVALPSVAMLASTAPVLAIIQCVPSDPDPATGNFFSIYLTTNTAIPVTVQPGSPITIAGNGTADMNATWSVLAIYPGSPNLVILSCYLVAGTATGAGGTGTGAAATMVRQNNTVTVTTATPHQLRVGYQALIAKVPATAIGGGVSTIVIKNEDNPGLATVTMAAPHGLVPGNNVNITAVAAVAVGGVSTATFAGGVGTVTTTSAHGLAPGAVVTLVGANLTTPVVSILSDKIFTVAYGVAAPAGVTAVSLTWPIPDTETPTYFEVLAAPTATTFQVQLNYSDGTWVTGAVSMPWDGTYFVSAVPSDSSFQYQQYGPSIVTTSVGTVTPWGQMSPGKHQLQVLFLTRNGAITAPSPPATFEASGGQYPSVSNIAIGPPSVVARILAFTGADGAYSFYIPAPAQVNGQQVSTATQINDNTSTSAFLDFSDPTLFAATAISIPGNNLANQIVLDGALGFGFYASRLMTWGQRNRIQSLLNMGFDGGYLPSNAMLPTGWTYTGPGGALAVGHYGFTWSINVLLGGAHYGVLSQSMYQDAYGAPIATANTLYRLRVWLQPILAHASLAFTATISSVSAGFTATATVTGDRMDPNGGYCEAVFSLPTPAAIPADLTLTIYATNSSTHQFLQIDDISIIYDANPYTDTVLFGSYVDNPEGIDGVTGKFGPGQDGKKVMEIAELRQALCILTQDPGGRLHETIDNAAVEPAGWTVNELAANCGLLSAFGLTKSQADDSSASGGEEWFAWASASGVRIFGGDQPYKISQEVQPDWDQINPAARLTVWMLNDPVTRRIYMGLPYSVSVQAPSLIYVLDYRELDTAVEIAKGAPIHTSIQGRLISTDHTRKWTRWNLPSNGAALMFRETGKLEPVIFNGNKQAPGAAAGFGNVYTLNPAKLTDDDYGLIQGYYVTYFTPSHDQEQALNLGGGRKMLAYVSGFASGVGQLTIGVLCDALMNPWGLFGTRNLTLTPTFDFEWAGGNAQAQRMAIRFASIPLGNQTDNSFNLQKVTLWLRPAKLRIRGSAQ